MHGIHQRGGTQRYSLHERLALRSKGDPLRVPVEHPSQYGFWDLGDSTDFISVSPPDARLLFPHDLNQAPPPGEYLLAPIDGKLRDRLWDEVRQRHLVLIEPDEDLLLPLGA